MSSEQKSLDAASLAHALSSSNKSLYIGSDIDGPLFGSSEDHLLVIGPPRSGKSTGIFAPSIACHPGPVIVASIRHDLVSDTAEARRRIAEHFGGEVNELRLAGTTTLGDQSSGWRISDGCQNWTIAKDRAVSLAYTAIPPNNGDTFWRESVATALAGCLHGAALLGHSDSLLAANIRLADLEIYRDSVAVLDPNGHHPSTLSFAWLYNERVMAENTRKSLLAVMSGQVLGAFDYDHSDTQANLNIAEFVESWGTIYITVPYERKNVLSPLVTAFVEGVIAAWRENHRSLSGNRRTLLLALDEVANIAPLPSLPGIVTTGAGDGIQAIIGLQSPAQAEIWKDQADTILTGTSHVAIFPGLRAHDYIQSLTEGAQNTIAYTPVISVSQNLPGGDRYATAQRLTEERKYIEEHLILNPSASPHLVRLQAARHLSVRRRKDRVRTRSDEVSSPLSVLTEIMEYTDVRLDTERRSEMEPSDITFRARGEFTLISGVRAHFLKVQHWSTDPFWRTILNMSA